jgi:hypothetical protein
MASIKELINNETKNTARASPPDPKPSNRKKNRKKYVSFNLGWKIK